MCAPHRLIFDSAAAMSSTRISSGNVSVEIALRPESRHPAPAGHPERDDRASPVARDNDVVVAAARSCAAMPAENSCRSLWRVLGCRG